MTSVCVLNMMDVQLLITAVNESNLPINIKEALRAGILDPMQTRLHEVNTLRVRG